MTSAMDARDPCPSSSATLNTRVVIVGPETRDVPISMSHMQKNSFINEVFVITHGVPKLALVRPWYPCSSMFLPKFQSSSPALNSMLEHHDSSIFSLPPTQKFSAPRKWICLKRGYPYKIWWSFDGHWNIIKELKSWHFTSTHCIDPKFPQFREVQRCDETSRTRVAPQL